MLEKQKAKLRNKIYSYLPMDQEYMAISVLEQVLDHEKQVNYIQALKCHNKSLLCFHLE